MPLKQLVTYLLSPLILQVETPKRFQQKLLRSPGTEVLPLEEGRPLAANLPFHFIAAKIIQGHDAEYDATFGFIQGP